MATSDTGASDLSVGAPRRDRRFWTIVALSAATACVAVAVGAQIAMTFSDRHFYVTAPWRAIWDVISLVVDSRAFALVYLIVPPVWVVVAIQWWTTHGASRSSRRLLLLAVSGAMTLFGLVAWLATVMSSIKWAFSVEGVPHVLVTLGVGDADPREPLLVSGLACLAGAAISNGTAMLYSSSKGHVPRGS